MKRFIQIWQEKIWPRSRKSRSKVHKKEELDHSGESSPPRDDDTNVSGSTAKQSRVGTSKHRGHKAKKKDPFFPKALMGLKKISYVVMNNISTGVAKLWAMRPEKQIKESQELISAEESQRHEENPSLAIPSTRRRISLKKYFFISVVCLGFFGGCASLVFWRVFIQDNDVVDVATVQSVASKQKESQEDRQDYKEIISIDLVKPVATSGILSTINPDYFRLQPVFADPHLFVVVKNVGINTELMEDCFELDPKEVSIALSPYTPQLSEVIDDFHDEGYVTLLSLPLQGANLAEDQGPFVMATNQANDNRLEKLLSVVESYDGFLLDRGELFLKDKEAVRGLQIALNRLKKMIIAPPDVLNNQWHVHAASLGLPTISAFVENPVIEDLEAIRQFAERAGYVIVTFDLSKYDDLSSINQWIKNAIDVKLIPSSLSKLMIHS